MNYDLFENLNKAKYAEAQKDGKIRASVIRRAERAEKAHARGRSSYYDF